MCARAPHLRWLTCFPAARTLLLGDAACADAVNPPLCDDDLLQLASGRQFTSVYMSHLSLVGGPGLQALCGPALTALVMRDVRQVSGAELAAATARSPRLRTLHVDDIGDVVDADLAGWGRLHHLALEPCASDSLFTGAGVSALTQVRLLHLHLPAANKRLPLAAFQALPRLEELVVRSFRSDAPEIVDAATGIFVGTGRLPPSLRFVALHGLVLRWAEGRSDGGAAVLAPLADVGVVRLCVCKGVTDEGLAQLTGAYWLELRHCWGVTGHFDEGAPGAAWGALTDLRVLSCPHFRGEGLARHTALQELIVENCPFFHADVLATLAPRCPSLGYVAIDWRGCKDVYNAAPPPSERVAGMVYPQPFDVAAAEAALTAAAAGTGGGAGWTFKHGDESSWTATRGQQ